MIRITGAIIVVLAIAGCDMIVPPWKLSSLKETAHEPVICTAGKDCDEKWALALTWLQRNSQLPLVIQTDSRLETAKSTALNPHPGFVITKTPPENGISTITFQASCDDDFGCSPPLLELRAGFVKAIMGAPAS